MCPKVRKEFLEMRSFPAVSISTVIWFMKMKSALYEKKLRLHRPCSKMTWKNRDFINRSLDIYWFPFRPSQSSPIFCETCYSGRKIIHRIPSHMNCSFFSRRFALSSGTSRKSKLMHGRRMSCPFMNPDFSIA
jgi:hypothetical protein